jgi:hypothetical protein
VRTAILTLAVLLAALPLVGCTGSAPGRAVRTLPPGTYTDTFDAARDALRSRGFELARIDARLGVIETRPEASSGLATPWDRQSADMGARWRGLAHFERRRATVSFVPSGDRATGANQGNTAEPLADLEPDDLWALDLREWQGPVVMRVEIARERLVRPGKRVDATSVGLTTVGIGRQADGRDLTGDIEIEPAGYDVDLARLIADEIIARR